MGIGSLLGKMTGVAVGETAKAIGDAADKIFTSDEERLAYELEQQKLQHESDGRQIEINKVEASSGHFFQSGWRPFIGWTCGVGIAYSYVFSPVLTQLFGFQTVELHMGDLIALVIALLGMSATRTYEKMKGINK